MNLPEVLMGVAAGIGILAALTHGLVGFARRPRDRALIAFAVAAGAAAAGALSVLALYTITDIDLHITVMKWAFFPATVVWTLAIVWFAAFFAEVRPRWFLYALSAGFAFTLVVNAVLPRGILHQQKGGLMEMDTIGGSVMVMTQSQPHALQNVTDALTLLSFAFLCYAVYRVFRRPSHARAWSLGLMTALLAVATMFDAIIEHRVVITFNNLYLSQVSFAVVIIAVSLGLRRESLKVEHELQLYRTHMDELVEARVRELDQAHARLAEEERERGVAEDMLRRRVEELNTLQRIAEIFGGQATLEQALSEATDSAARLFEARYARVTLLPTDDDAGEMPIVAGHAAFSTGGGDPAGTLLDQEISAAALHEGATIAAAAAAWPGLSDEARRTAAADDLGVVLAHPLIATAGPIGVFIVARRSDRDAFSDEEGRLARTIGDALAAVVEIDRLHRQETQQALADERQALARDLHDAVTQSIYSATLIAEALPAVYQRDPDEGLRNLERLRRLVRAALAEMRTLLFELRPAALQTAPLDVLVERLGDALSGQTDISVNVCVDEALALPPDVKVALYRVIQEAFSNIAKHARATAVSARVEAAGDGVALTIVDDGRGFDPAAVPEGHMGLHIMAERAAGVRAELSVLSTPGEGTTVTALWHRTASNDLPLERMQA